MKETRTTIVLTRLARKKRKETGDNRYQAKAEIEKESLITLIKISCTRPICQYRFPVFYCDQLTLFFRPLGNGAHCTEFQCRFSDYPSDTVLADQLSCHAQLWIGFTWGVVFALVEYVASHVSFLLSK
jgi:hypothetical protein